MSSQARTLPAGASRPQRGLRTTVPQRELHLALDGMRSWLAGENERPGRCIGWLGGDSGSGKTLIVRALQRGCSTLGVRWATASCMPRASEPLAPVLGWLRQLLGAHVPDTTPFERKLLARISPDLADCASSIHSLSDLEPRLDRSRLVDGIARLLVARAGDEPLVLFLEDVQWIDERSLDVLEACLRIIDFRSRCGSPPEGRDPATASSSPAAGTVGGAKAAPRLLFVLSGRPGSTRLAVAVSELCRPRQMAFEVQFRGYSRDDLADACGTLGLQDAPLSLREEIFQRSGANPRCINQVLVLSCLKESGHCDFSWPRGRRPLRVSDLLAQRFEILAPQEQQLLRLVALLVRPVEVRALAGIVRAVAAVDELADLVGLDETSLEALCVRLRATGWLRGHLEPLEGATRWRVDDESAAAWLEALWSHGTLRRLHEVLGNALLASCRHNGSAEGIFEAWHHLLQAGIETEAAFEAGLIAAELAERRGSIERCLEVRDRLLERLDVIDESSLGAICEDQARLLEVVGAHREALDILQSLDDGQFGIPSEVARARYAVQSGRLVRHLEGPREELARYELARSCAPSIPACWRVRLELERARALFDLGRRSEAEPLLESCDTEIRKHAPHEGPEWLPVLRACESLHYRLRNLDRAETLEREIARLAGDVGNAEEHIRSLRYLAGLALMRGDTAVVFPFLELAIGRAREIGSRDLEAQLEAELGRARGVVADPVGSLIHYERARDLLSELGRDEDAAAVEGVLSYLYLSQRRWDEALLSLRRHVDARFTAPLVGADLALRPVYEDAEQRHRRLAALRRRQGSSRSAGADAATALELGDLLLDEGRIGEAMEVYRRLRRAPCTARNPFALVYALQRLGRVQRMHARYGEALAHVEKSLECLGPVLQKELVATAYLEVADVLRVQGNIAVAYSYLLRGYRLYVERAGAQGVTFALVLLCRFFGDVGMGHLACELATTAAAMARRARMPREEVEALCVLARQNSEQGAIHASGAVLDRAEEVAERLDVASLAARVALARGWNALRQASFELARRHARESIDRARSLDDRALLIESLALFGATETAAVRQGGNFLRGVEALKQSLATARDCGDSMHQRTALELLASVYRRRGQADLADEYAREAAELLERVRCRVPESFWSGYSSEAGRRLGALLKPSPLESDAVEEGVAEALRGSAASPAEVTAVTAVTDERGAKEQASIGPATADSGHTTAVESTDRRQDNARVPL